LGLATGILFGLMPAVSISGRRLTESLKDTRRFASRWGGRGLRNLLVAGQVTLTVVLIAGAGLLMRSFDRLQRVDPGIRVAGVLMMDLELPEERYASVQAQAGVYARVLDSVRKNRGIEAAALVDAPPFGPTRTFPFRIEGRPEPPAGNPVFLISRGVSPGYFAVLGIPLVRGRLFSDSDGPGVPGVAVISETMAARHWPGQDPIGKRFRMGYDRYRPWLTIVGIVKDTRQRWLDTPFIEVYRPLSQDPRESVSLLVRAPGGPRQWTDPLSRALRKADPLLAGGSPRSLERIVAGELAGSRFQSRMILLFASLAVILAAVGIYGVVSHSVARRTHEIGIRVALGAQPGDVLRRVLFQGMAPVAAGIILGLGAARLLGGLLADQLYEVRPGDPLTFTLAVVVIVSAGLVATYLPAQRATQVDPMAALREE
ncbi:MAG TPA: ABC transporter permease, partial [Thermoanaerobaculia bacterium]|nr:ABC transporter permease [Thermoanaerobaculia bacterium]